MQGDGLKNGLGIWIMPLYQSNSVWGMKAENFKTGYNSNLGGIAMGADYTINDMFRFGAAFKRRCRVRQIQRRFQQHGQPLQLLGVSLYGGWVYNNFPASLPMWAIPAITARWSRICPPPCKWATSRPT